MLNQKKIVVVLPAYNAANTLEKTYREIPFEIVDEVVLVDDSSNDKTVSLARSLGIKNIAKHRKNQGYGANQKTCYKLALEMDADIIVMLHPDYQYSPSLIPAMTSLIALDVYPVVFGSRILGKGALEGGMPLYKYISNRALTLFQNILLGEKLSEYHTGYRAYSAEALRNINFKKNSNNFIFDNEIVSQIFMAGYSIAEVTCPTRYSKDSSSIKLGASIRYGLGVIRVSVQHALHRIGALKNERYSKIGVGN